MARRKGRKKSQRRTPKTINALNLAEGYMLANVVTETMFRTNPVTFLTGYSNGKFNLGDYGGSNTLTLPEIIQGPQVSKSFQQYGATTTGQLIKYNLERNNSAAKLAFGVVGIPIAFRVGKKVMRKPRSQLNALLKMTGLGVRV